LLRREEKLGTFGQGKVGIWRVREKVCVSFLPMTHFGFLIGRGRRWERGEHQRQQVRVKEKIEYDMDFIRG
jgi:hypothetical protein